MAELSNNHNGSLDRAKRMIKAAKDAGADFVKFQCFTPDELVALRGDGPAPEPWGSDGYTMASLYAKAQTPHEWFPELVEHAREVGIVWFSSVFGLASLALLESLECPAYKVAAEDSGGKGLSRWVTASGKPVIRSLRGDGTITVADGTIGPDEFLMLCPVGYPQEKARLAEPPRITYSFGGFEGYSYHGTNPETPALAALCGAKLIEVHVMLGDEPSELEANVSLTEMQFAGMVGRIRYSEGLLGEPSVKPEVPYAGHGVPAMP